MTVLSNTPPPLVPAPMRSGPAAAPRTVSAIVERVARRPEDLAALEPAWRALRTAHGLPTVNTDPDCFRAVLDAQAEGVRPHVVVFERGGTPCALVVGRRSHRRTHARLGYWRVRGPRLRCLDVCYGGLVTDGTPAASRAVARHLRTLLRRREIDRVLVNHLPEAHPLFARLTDRRRFPGARAERRASVHWRFTFADGPFAATLDRFKRKHRYNLRRADRRLAEHCGGRLDLAHVTTETDLERFLTDAEALTRSGYHGAIGAGLSNPAVQGALLGAAARTGRLRRFVLRAGDRPLAFHAGVLEGDTYHLLATAFDTTLADFSPGQVLLLRVMEALRDDAVATLDYGFGDAGYKRVYGTDAWDERTVRLTGRSLRGRAARTLEAGADALTRGLRRLVATPERIERLKQRWRSRLTDRAAGARGGDGC